MTIICTVSIYGLIARNLAQRLGLASMETEGILFVGANAFGLALAKSIQEEGFRALLIDSNRENVEKARLEGLSSLHANVFSYYFQDEIDLEGIGKLVAITPNNEVNSLAAMRFTDIFGRAGVYQLNREENKRRSPQSEAPNHLTGRTLFSRNTTFATLQEKFNEGSYIKPILITENNPYSKYTKEYGESMLPLFLITERHNLQIFSADLALSPHPGQKLIALLPSKEEDITTGLTKGEL